MERTSYTSKDESPDPDLSRPAEGLNPAMPQYIRLPKAGSRCPWTGLSRSKLNQLILPCDENGHCPPVKSLSLRPRGALKGTRLILLESLLDYLSSQLEGGEG